jgi:hypothetical protein
MELLIEAERRGILPAEKAAMLTEARRRGLVAEPARQPSTAQEQIDAVPRRPAMQPQLVDEQGRDYNAGDLDNVNSVYDIPKLRVEQRPTGRDLNVQPGNAGFKANFKSAFVEDPQTQMRIFAKALFPDDPNAARRFGMRDGRVVYLDDDGGIRDVEHGFGSRTGHALGYAPETAGAIAGSFATGNPVVGGSLGAAGGKGLKQMIGGLVFDEPQTTSGNLKGMAKEGAMTLVSGGLAKGAGKFFDKGRVVDFTPEQIGTARATQEQVQRTAGITLDLAQASGDPVLLALRKYAAKFPGESSQVFKALDELQTGQSADAMQKLIGVVSRSMSSEAAGRQGINAAQEAIRAARANVSQQVKPLYDAAYAAVPEVADPKILAFLKLPYFQQAYKAGQRIATLEGNAAAKPDLRALDYTKRALDDQVESLMQSGNRQSARAVKLKRDEFVSAIDAIPNQQWQAARRKYAELARSTIEPLENGAVGTLSRIKDAKAATAAAKLFSDPAITAQEVALARNAVSKADPEAWSALSGQYLATVLDRSLKVSQRGEATNLAGKLYQALAGTPQQALKVRTALPAGAQAHLDDMLKGLKLVAATERAGSDTAFNQLVTQKIAGRFSTTLKLLRQPIQTAIQSGEDQQLDRLVANLARGLTDPARVASLRQVSKMPPGVERSLYTIAALSLAPGGRYLEGELFPAADMPIPAAEPRRGTPRLQQLPGQ